MRKALVSLLFSATAFAAPPSIDSFTVTRLPNGDLKFVGTASNSDGPLGGPPLGVTGAAGLTITLRIITGKPELPIGTDCTVNGLGNWEATAYGKWIRPGTVVTIQTNNWKGEITTKTVAVP